ncbi:hypothetical protein MBLNU13_g01025t1 [Cladosporium sp. NU13]
MAEGSSEFKDSAGRESRTHDFTFNNAPILELRDLSTCLENFQLREKYLDDAQGLKTALEQRSVKDLQFAPTQLPNRHFLSYTMYSQSAFRYGKYVAKYALFSTSTLQKDLTNEYQITENANSEQHSAWLKESPQQRDAESDLRVQLLKNVDEQSVEDSSVELNEKKYPFEAVARVVLPKGQDAWHSMPSEGSSGRII